MTLAIKDKIRKVKELHRRASTPGEKSAAAAAIDRLQRAHGKPASKRATKRSIVIRMLLRQEGATLDAIMRATDWQEHTVRSFVSASVGKEPGNRVVSDKNAKGERRFRLYQGK